MLCFGSGKYTVSEVGDGLESFRRFLAARPAPSDISRYVSEHFDVYRSVGADGDGEVLFTGYYTPELPVRESPDDTFKYPVYGLPADLVTADLGRFKDKYKGEKIAGMVKDGALVPYYARADIDGGGALSGRGLEIAWSSDAVELFFMQVQGSGTLKYPDGTLRHANYAGSNGRPYRSIGKFLIEQGKADIEGMSMDFIRKYLGEHSGEAPAIMGYNEGYVFFKIEDAGPYGSFGTPVTPGRTIAADRASFPPGAVAYIETEVPGQPGGPGSLSWTPYFRFVLFQDTGGAVKGPGRVDIYFGSGEAARFRAGYMRRKGRLYFLVGKRRI